MRVNNEVAESAIRRAMKIAREQFSKGEEQDNPQLLFKNFPGDGQHNVHFYGDLAWGLAEMPDTVTYTFGPRDIAWLDQRTNNYFHRLHREGRLLSAEPNGDTELRHDHTYAQNIKQLYAQARKEKEDARVRAVQAQLEAAQRQLATEQAKQRALEAEQQAKLEKEKQDTDQRLLDRYRAELGERQEVLGKTPALFSEALAVLEKVSDPKQFAELKAQLTAVNP